MIVKVYGRSDGSLLEEIGLKLTGNIQVTEAEARGVRVPQLDFNFQEEFNCITVRCTRLDEISRDLKFMTGSFFDEPSAVRLLSGLFATYNGLTAEVLSASFAKFNPNK